MNLRTLFFLFWSALALVAQGAQSPRPFSDVPKNHWAAKAVNELKALGLLTGYPGGRFRG